MQIPVLTYHAVNITSNAYHENDHVAFAADLRLIHGLGCRVIPLRKLFGWHQGEIPANEVRGAVALTLDDGSWFDFHDLPHPVCGIQRGMLGIMQDFHNEFGAEAQPELHASSFVICSPEARRELDSKGLVGKGWWGDEWWPEAVATGLMSVECHSWDHNHPDLERVAQRDQLKGSFRYIDNLEDCEIQLAKAAGYIRSRLGKSWPAFFAYPWGEASEYLMNTYLPEYEQRHGFLAAFTTEPRAVSAEDSRWQLPRFVCGRDWRSTGELEALITAASGE